MCNLNYSFIKDIQFSINIFLDLGSKFDNAKSGTIYPDSLAIL